MTVQHNQQHVVYLGICRHGIMANADIQPPKLPGGFHKHELLAQQLMQRMSHPGTASGSCYEVVRDVGRQLQTRAFATTVYRPYLAKLAIGNSNVVGHGWKLLAVDRILSKNRKLTYIACHCQSSHG